MKIEKYDKSKDYSFSFGFFPTFEMLKAANRLNIITVLIHSKCKNGENLDKLLEMCANIAVPILHDDKLIEKIADKENIFVVGVFKKFDFCEMGSKNIVLVNPSDMGNLGTIMRTCLGFGFHAISIIRPAVDVFNPKVVRASMGAIFALNLTEFETVEKYLKISNNNKFLFMLDGKSTLGTFHYPSDNFDLVFGNEGSGLPQWLHQIGTSVVIKHSKDIDSLNLPISVALALYEFSQQYK